MKRTASSADGRTLRDVILGGQDGLVNVLGIVLGVATAEAVTRTVLIAGLAATVAESLSMGAVAYTSGKAARDFYRSHRVRADGSSVFEHPLRSGVVVGLASVIGSLIPLVPFFFIAPGPARWVSAGVCTAVLFVVGCVKGRITRVTHWKSGAELAIIGMLSALAGYVVGLALSAI